MLMKDNKKNSVSLIMGKLMGDKKEGESQEAPSQDGVEQDASIGMETAAQELLSAIEQKSSKGIVEAIKSMIEMASQEEPEEQE